MTRHASLNVRRIIGRDVTGAPAGEVVITAWSPQQDRQGNWACDWEASGLIEKRFQSGGIDPMQAITAMIFDINVIVETLVPDGVSLFWEDGRPYRELDRRWRTGCPLARPSCDLPDPAD